jgi:lipid-binding SYLF domain-containing protein
VSCRPDRGGAWSNPAAIAIEGGGTFWPVVGSEIDLILLATNRLAASRFGDSEAMLGSGNLGTIPGPVREDQMPRLNTYPVVFAYQQSSAGIGGINISGATMKEDQASNAVLYGKELSNQAILERTGEGRRPMAADLFLAALSSSDQAYTTER